MVGPLSANEEGVLNVDEAQENTREVGSESAMVLASRWKRLGGALIDAIVNSVVATPILVLAGVLDFEAISEGRQMSLQQSATGALIGIAVMLLIHGYLLATRGQTVGKLALGTRIVDASGNVPPFVKLFVLRYAVLAAVYNLPIVGSLVAVVNALMIFGKEKRCLHDLIAGTWVEDVPR